jgi:hypothetical protein
VAVQVFALAVVVSQKVGGVKKGFSFEFIHGWVRSVGARNLTQRGARGCI